MLPLAARQLNERFARQIPMASHMELRITAWDGRELRMDAPLAPNLNDKGTGFAGSLATLATLAGWALATLAGEKAIGRDCEAAVFESEIRYLAPVTGDFFALASGPADEELQRFFATLEKRGRARLSLTAAIFQGNEEKVRYRGRYAVWVRPES